MQPITDKLCVKYGLPKLKYDKGNQKGVSYGEWKDGGKSSWKKMIRADIDYAISKSETYEEFLEQMGSMHYQIREGTSQGRRRNFVFEAAWTEESTAERKRKH